MDTVTAIFTQLGVDSSLLPQFLIVFGMFVIAKFLFLNHLQFVLENREEKTVKLESSADLTLENVNKMAQEYKSKIDGANKEAMKVVSSKKAEIQARHGETFKKTEKEINQFVENSRQDFEREIKSNEAKFLGEVDSLAGDLVKKILN
jgi:F0F1-type ATP synthase membrane subunit b/b'